MRKLIFTAIFAGFAFIAGLHAPFTAHAQGAQAGTEARLDHRFPPFPHMVTVHHKPSFFSKDLKSILLCGPNNPRKSCTNLLFTGNVSSGWVEVTPDPSSSRYELWTGWILADFLETKDGVSATEFFGKNYIPLEEPREYIVIADSVLGRNGPRVSASTHIHNWACNSHHHYL